MKIFTYFWIFFGIIEVMSQLSGCFKDGGFVDNVGLMFSDLILNYEFHSNALLNHSFNLLTSTNSSYYYTCDVRLRGHLMSWCSSHDQVPSSDRDSFETGVTLCYALQLIPKLTKSILKEYLPHHNWKSRLHPRNKDKTLLIYQFLEKSNFLFLESAIFAFLKNSFL